MTGAAAAWALRSDCPLTPRISPYADQVQVWLVDRLSRASLPLDGTGLERLNQARFARYAARLYPDARESELRVVSLLFTWFFLIDDVCDGRLGSAPEQLRSLRDGILRLLRRGAAARHPGFVGPLRRLLADAWRTPRREMPTRWQERFADAVEHHLDGAWLEAANKAADHRPGVPEYIRLRRATSAAYVSYALTEFVTRRPLPDAVYHHPLLCQLADAGNDLLSWFNDLVSLERDQATAGGHNLVLALAHERNVPVATAVELTVERWRMRMEQFTELRAAIPSFGPELDPAVADQLAVVCNSVRGTIDWSLESARYAGSPVVPGAADRISGDPALPAVGQSSVGAALPAAVPGA